MRLDTMALTTEELDSLRRLTSCQVADAIETFHLRLRNEGFTNSSIRCVFPELPPMVGYAVTARIRTSEPPMSGTVYPDRTDWWNHLLTVAAPRVLVLHDLDRPPGRGSCAGEVHSHIYKALGCVGLVTNGAVRDLVAAEQLGFSFFAGAVAVSHAYYHMIDFGARVELAGLKIDPGDLLHGDRHGVISVPQSAARNIPAAAARISRLERQIIEVAASPNPSVDQLREAVRQSVEEDLLRG